MEIENLSGILTQNISLESVCLGREVKLDFYVPKKISDPASLNLLLINDGQDLPKMDFAAILNELTVIEKTVEPLLCVGIHCAPDRKMEYGIAGVPDFIGRGAKADLFSTFVTTELLELISKTFGGQFKNRGYAGFSLGGLMAMDIGWKHHGLFNKLGIFSGSLWWRSIDQTEEDYDDDKHRIMHQQIRHGKFIPGLKFFFQCGNKDETKDRNNNGIIDSIEDTQDLIKELVLRGYSLDDDIKYLELADGRHDVETWGRAMPEFLKWGFGCSPESRVQNLELRVGETESPRK